MGDEGLLTFFRRVYSVLRKGGRFILEPQTWESYKKAKRNGAQRQGLKMRPEEFGERIAEMGFSKGVDLGSTGSGGFHRCIMMFTKKE